MELYCVREGHITPEELELLREIKILVELLPDIDLGKDEDGEDLKISCHFLARAIGKVYRLRVVDGYLHPTFCHSWILTPQDNILDVYPVAIAGGPIIVVGQEVFWNAPSHFHYKPRQLKLGTHKPCFRRALAKLTKQVRETRYFVKRAKGFGYI